MKKATPQLTVLAAARGAGLAADDASHPGFAGLLANLLSEGTAKRDSRAIAETAQGLGGGPRVLPAATRALPVQQAPAHALCEPVSRLEADVFIDLEAPLLRWRRGLPFARTGA